MDTEEIQIKLQMKADQLNQELRKIQQESEKAAKHVGDSFVHVEGKGRAFKKLLHEISDVSPIMGIALRGALDPTVALIIGITNALKEYEKEQEKAIKRSEEKEKHSDEVESARRESATDSEFLAKKKVLDFNEQYRAAHLEEIALSEEQGAAAKVNDEERIRSFEHLKHQLDAIKELQKEGATAGFGGGKEKGEMLGLFSKDQQNAITQAVGTDRANLYAKMRQDAEAELRDKESAMAKDKELLAESKTNVTDLNKAKRDAEKAVKDDERKLFDAQRKEKADSVKQEIE